MKLCIFGRHPIPQGGFNGVMSLFEAIEFSRLGYETHLLLPFPDSEAFSAFLDQHQLSDLNELPRFGGRFSIAPVFPDEDSFPECDVLIYQSYDHNDWTRFSSLCRSKSRLVTKNLPKFVSGPFDENDAVQQLAYFDLAACALKEDFDLLAAMPRIAKEYRGSFAYVPRGASPTLLHAGYKFGAPAAIGFDVPNNDAVEALQHHIEPVKRLRLDYHNLRTLTIGRDVKELRSSSVPFGRFDRIYETFFNSIHLYCTINYQYSPDHLRAPVQHRAEGWRNRAIYEVQNIESQMSGAVLIGHRNNIIDELYLPGVTGLNVRDYSEEAEIYYTLKAGLEQWHAMVGNVRRFAVDNFSWSHCIRLWSDAIQTRLTIPRRN